MPEKQLAVTSAATAITAMCSNNNNDAVFRGAAGGNLCSIPEDGDLVTFAEAEAAATGSELQGDLWLSQPPLSSSSGRERGPRRRKDARGRCDALNEQRIFHRSPVSLDNGYKPAVLSDTHACASSDESSSRSPSDDIPLEDRDKPGRESLSYAKTIACRVAALLGAIIGVGAALLAVAVGTLLLRDRLWS